MIELSKCDISKRYRNVIELSKRDRVIETCSVIEYNYRNVIELSKRDSVIET